MKKRMIAAVSVAALAAAFANADVSVKLNSRTRPSLFKYTKDAQDNSTITVTDMTGAGSASDTLSVNAKGENASVNVDLAINNGTNTIAPDTKYWATLTFGNFNLSAGKFESIFTKRYNTTLVEEGLTDQSWLKHWGLGTNLVTGFTKAVQTTEAYSEASVALDADGKTTKDYYKKNTDNTYTKIAKGTQMSGSDFGSNATGSTATGAVQYYEKKTVALKETGVSVDKDGKLAAEYYGSDGSVYKKGSAYDSSLTYYAAGAGSAASIKTVGTGTDLTKAPFGWLVDVNNLSAVGSTRVLSAIADYTIEDVADGKLVLKAGIFDSPFRYNSNDDADSIQNFKAGYSLDIGLAREDLTFEAVARMFATNRYAFGAYFAGLTLIPDSTIAAGVTYGLQLEDSDFKTSGGTAELYELDPGKAVATLRANALAADLRFINNSVKNLQLVAQMKFSMLNGDAVGDQTIIGLNFAGQVGYTVNDMIDAAFDVAFKSGDLSNKLSADLGTMSIVVRPAVAVKANKNAKLTAAVQFEQALKTGDMKDAGLTSNVTSLSIPLILRVKL